MIYKVSQIILMLLLLKSCASANQHLICKSVPDVFSENGDSASPMSPRRYQGPPGRIGPPGAPGSAGLRGPPGATAVVDYERLNSTINGMISNALEELRSQITELEANLTALQSETIGRLASISCEEDHFSYNEKCFFAIVQRWYGMMFDAAKSLCNSKGMLLAEIHDKTEQIALEGFLRSKIPSGQTIAEVWIGMQYVNSGLEYRSGVTAPSSRLRWRDSGFPIASVSKQWIAFDVYKPQGRYSKGIWNTGKSTRLQGVMCEKRLQS